MQLYPLKLLPTKTNFNFMHFKKISYTVSIILSVLCLISITLYKFNFGIDFAGGISIEVRSTQTPDLTKMREILGELNIGEVMIQHFGSERDLSIRVGSNSEENLLHNINLIKTALNTKLPYKFDYRKVDFVGPQIGAQLIQSGLIALTLSFIAIMIYIWIRFEWYFGMGVLIALIHDAILALGFMSITRLDFNLSTIAAILTIIGYSVNDSVVIYDRIRENLRKFAQKPIDQTINISINETLSRTILTVLTTLLAALALVVFGGEAIHSFSILIFFGIIAGTYSSIFISAPILTIFAKQTKYRIAKKN
ncbi:protein translocase subunit SecF [Candidatus Trichorickettsia mobilis]|uniref:protein translocase subunit SecF n=1 Tax=Candidatus Trichorickettsia mobilis TaxID=1346319 RepID=UPI00292CD1B0|nr:protein translocase subunit SecF [Candidatus Trichorickettsia mobilis]